jgi:hypothetical protein
VDVIALRNTAIAMGLDLSQDYLDASYKLLTAVCNGVGPGWLPEEAREKVSEYFEYFLPSVCQHDFDFTFLAKLRKYFNIANKRFWYNMKLQISQDKTLLWFSWDKDKSRIRKYLQARFLYKMVCTEAGYRSFMDASLNISKLPVL